MKIEMIRCKKFFIFIYGILFFTGFNLYSSEIVSVRIKDSFLGDTPDGFPSPGEKIALSISVIMDFMPDESYIVCDTELVQIEEAKTRFSKGKSDTLLNDILEPTLLLRKNCPTDRLIPVILVYRKDTIFDTLSFNIHTVAVLDSCYPVQKVSDTNNKLLLHATCKTVDGHPSGYTSILTRIMNSKDEFIEEVKLFDDGKHFDGVENDGLFGNSWWTPSSASDFIMALILKDSTVNHTFEMKEVTGFSTKGFSFDNPYIIIGDPYSCSPANEAVNVVSELMDSLDLDYDIWNLWFRGCPDSNEIALWGARKAIIVWATKNGGTLRASTLAKQLIQDFLEMGGNLFLATAYLGNYVKDYGSEADSIFYEDILCSKFITRFESDNGFSSLLLRSPFTDEVMDTFALTLSSSDSNRFTSFADIIKPISPAIPVVSLLEKKDSTVTIDTIGCFGLKIKKDNYKVLYLSYNIGEISPFSLRKDFFEEGLKWLSEETSDTFSYQPVLEEEKTFVELADPYPNPFLKESTIPFTLLTPGNVSLIICDLSGRTVRRLIHSSLSKGNYYIVWDGKNEKGDETAVGYYFVRLAIKTVAQSTGENVEDVVSKKLLKLRK